MWFLVRDLAEVAPVVGGAERTGQHLQLLAIDVAHAVGHLLGTSDLHALPLFQRAHEIAGIAKAVGRAGVEPGIAAAELLDAELAGFR